MKKLLLAFTVLFFAVQMLNAQITISGKVVNKKGGKPIAEVTIQGLNAQGKVLVTTKSGADGKFTINLPGDAINIEVRKDGYQPRTLSVGKKKKMKIEMLPN